MRDGEIVEFGGERWEVVDPPWWRPFRWLWLKMRPPERSVIVSQGGRARAYPLRSVPRPYAELDGKVEQALEAERQRRTRA